MNSPTYQTAARGIRVLAVVTALVLPFIFVASLPADINKKIIFIMVDDLGYGDLGCYGQKVIKTPNIDRLAAEGIRFTSHYSGHTVCRPSRLSLLMGKHTGHTPISSNAGYVLKAGDVTLTGLLEKNEFLNVGWGKWALGGVGSTGHPNKHGFHYWFGYLDQGRAHNYYPEYLYRNSDKVTLPGNVLMEDPKYRGRVAKLDHRVTYSHSTMVDDALTQLVNVADRQFFMHLHLTIPHTNNEGGRAVGDGQEVPDYGIYKDKDWPNPEKGFAAMITLLDTDIGRIIKRIKDLKIEKDTLVIFTSDNGPHQEGGHKMEFFNSNGDLRGYKRDLYEGGIRVPFIAWWPGKIKPGTVSDHPSAFWDLMPTICELAGIDAPKDTDGISFLPTLLGRTEKQKKHEYLYWQSGPKRAVRAGHWKANRIKANGPIELYDLNKDVGEKNNIAAKHPDVVKKMQAYMDDAVKK